MDRNCGEEWMTPSFCIFIVVAGGGGDRSRWIPTRGINGTRLFRQFMVIARGIPGIRIHTWKAYKTLSSEKWSLFS